MSFISNTISATKKNIKRMIRSPITLAILFLGPFLVLLLIQTAYQQNTSEIELKIGLVFESNDTILDSIQANIQTDTTRLRRYKDMDSCIERVKWGIEDACMYMGVKNGKPVIEFKVDYSKINFVTTITRVLNDRIADQAVGFRGNAVDELVGGVESSVTILNSMKDNIDNLYSDNGPLSQLDAIKDSSPSADLDGTRSDLENVENKARNVYRETDMVLSDVLDQLDDVRTRTSEQKQTISYLKTYGSNCDSKHLPDIEAEINSGTDPNVISSRIEEYGKCKCVEFYGDNLDDIDDDLTQILGYINDVRSDVYDAQDRNEEFLSAISGTVSGQQSQLNSFEYQNDQFQKDLTLFATSMLDNFDSIKSSIEQAEAGTADLLENVGTAKGLIQNPIDLTFKPISEDRKLAVYFFPMMYFFILTFIALIFTSTFVFSERKSKASNRNNLSPISVASHVSSIFISLGIVIALQSLLLLTLANFSFNLNLTLPLFLKIILTTSLIISIFLLIGIILGYLFDTQLLVMFGAIGLLIVAFIYSSVIFPKQLLAKSAQFIISINPFSIGVDVVGRFTLFDLPLGILHQHLIVLIVEFILLIFLSIAIISYKENKSS